MHRRSLSPLALAAALAVVPAGRGLAYPGGTPSYVTDVAPFCSSCHSSLVESELAGVPPERAQSELAANKHIVEIRSARRGSPYAGLSEQQRSELIAGIEKIDAAASVQLLAPATLKPGQVFEVTVEAKGGGGPVVGLALVDAAQRFQARPAPGAGWVVMETPRVVGPDGQPQTRFTDGRDPALAPGISYVNVYGVSADTAAGKYSSVSATFRLRAPSQPGTYPLAAAFWYGTEKGSPHGAVDTPTGRKMPVGKFGGHGGRVRFSSVLQIKIE